MADTIISQFDRAFANPIETDRQVNFISDRDAISALIRWEGMQVYVKSELTTFELRGGILNEHWTDTSGIDSANYTPTGGYTGTAQDIFDSIEITTSGVEIISVTHLQNLDYYVIADPYKVISEYYSASPTTITLDVGDSLPRIDVPYGDVNGVIGVLKGVPNATPVKPIVDSNTQRELTFILVEAFSTAPSTVTNELVFDENTGIAGGEFDVTGAGLTYLDFNSTAVAFSGTKSMYFNGVNPYFYVDFQNDVNISLSNISTFYFRVYLPELIDRNAELVFQLLDTSFNVAGSARIIKDGYFGLDRNVLNAWQIISVPIAFFNYPNTEFKGIRFTVSRSRKPKMYMDSLQFQFNVAQPAPLVNPLRYTQLTDTENTFVGQARKSPTVNDGETKLIFEEKQNKLTAGTNITIDETDPLNPIINASGGGVITDTDDLTEGTSNLYFTVSRVLATLLTGVSFVTGTAILATDTILQAFGKLQKQITDLTVVAKKEYMLYACSDEITDLVLGDAISIRMPYAMTLTEVRISLNEAPTITKFIADVKEGGVSIFSTLPSIDTTELTSVTASVPAVISDTSLADNDLLVVSVTQLGSGTIGKGFKILFIGQRA